MDEPVPVIALEIALRNVLRDKTTPVWSFYTPLAAAEIWVIAKHYPELDGSDLVAPAGQQPQLLTFTDNNGKWLPIYTARERTAALYDRFESWNMRRGDWIPIASSGYQLLRYAGAIDAHVCLNFCCEGFQKTLDPDMIEILLERGEPQPAPAAAAPREIARPAKGKPERYLAPLRGFLAKQPQVRAAWITMRDMPATRRPKRPIYEILLLQTDPDDKTLISQVVTIAKAVTPVEMEWSAGVMMAPADALRKLSERNPPFYATDEFRAELRKPATI